MKNLTKYHLYLSYGLILLFSYFSEKWIFPSLTFNLLYEFFLLISLFLSPLIFPRLFIVNPSISLIYTVTNTIIFMHLLRFLPVMTFMLLNEIEVNNEIISAILLFIMFYYFVPLNLFQFSMHFDKPLSLMTNNSFYQENNITIISPKARLHYNEIEDTWYIATRKNQRLLSSVFFIKIQKPTDNIEIWNKIIQKKYFGRMEINNELQLVSFDFAPSTKYAFDLSQTPSEYQQLLESSIDSFKQFLESKKSLNLINPIEKNEITT